MNYVDHTIKSSLTAISIGPGIRGIERGIERIVRLTHLAYVEIEAFIIENLVAQMERGVLDPAVIWSDAKTLPCEPFRGIVDILLAGYPCQPFSTAGKRMGVEDPRHLYPYIERAIRIIRPRICFFENVRGHVTCGLPEVIASLEGLGYRVHWGIYSAEETGAAHKRERVFILALLDDTESRRRLRQSINKRAACGNVNPLINPGELGDSELQSIDSIIGRVREESYPAGPELGHPASDNEQGKWDRPRIQQSEIGGPGPEELADDRSLGSVESLGGRQSKQFDKDGCKRIVSRPGQPQQTWEHPRVISRKVESAVGLSAHGYHFREDILRALGNSVYEDTAELAFRDLLRKHQITI